jgi:hypothetical protein
LGGLFSLNPKFLNSSFAIRFLHCTISEVPKNDQSDGLRTCPSYMPDKISPDSCTRDRSSPWLSSYTRDRSSWLPCILLCANL